MRSNSGRGEGTNNLHDPNLRDKEREKGVSGAAILGEKKIRAEPERKSSR